MAMAEHAELQYASATGNDLAAHEQTYRNFVTLVETSLASSSRYSSSWRFS
jgi:hypothetical protein